MDMVKRFPINMHSLSCQLLFPCYGHWINKGDKVKWCRVKSWPLLSIFLHFFLNLTLIPCVWETHSKPSKNNFVNNSIVQSNPYCRTWPYGVVGSTLESVPDNPSLSLDRTFRSFRFSFCAMPGIGYLIFYYS